MLRESPLFRFVAPFARRGAASLLVLAVAFTLGACGDDDPTDEDDDDFDDVIGTWVLQDAEGDAYIHITASTLSVYSENVDDACFLTITYDIQGVDGDEFTLSAQGDPNATFTATIERDGADLEVDGTPFEASDVDVDDLEICTLGVTCASLTALPLPADVDGNLETTDEQNPDGTFFDLHAFDVDSDATVTIAMTSSAFDTYLVLFDENGVYITENDDFGGSTNSRISRALAEGCYIVMATSFDAAETGAYTVTVD